MVSVAGAVGALVHDGDGRSVGVLDDVLVDSFDDRHPPVAGIVVRTRRGRTFAPIAAVADIRRSTVLLTGPPERELPAGLVALAHDVVDRQIVDVDGANVVRVSDLVLGREGQSFRLVGVDVSLRTLFRRLGPATLRRRISPERVYDWASVGAVSTPSTLHLAGAAAELRRRGPADVAQLLADLPPHEREQLATA